MTIEEKIDSMLERAKSKVRQKGRKQKIKLYAEGLKAKLREAGFSLKNLKECNAISPTTSDTGETFDIDEGIRFYCDCFWVFLYASLDVLAQIINHTEELRITDERDVDFKHIVTNSHLNSQLKQCLDNIQRTRDFTNLNKYRNCSLHRRHIYIKSIMESGTAGYDDGTTTQTGDWSTPMRYLCDDPYDLNPKTKKKREVTDYCKKTFDRISNLLGKVIDAILV